MKKFLLVDDREDEQERLFNKYNIHIDEYSEILDYISGEKYKTVFEILENEHIDYSVLIIHKSIFVDKYRKIKRKLSKIAKENNIALVYFSGNISISRQTQHPKLLEVSREDLYKNLNTFLNHSIHNATQLEILRFGIDWEIALLINVEDAIEKFLFLSSKEVDIRLFRSQINNLNSAVNILGNEEFFNLTGSVDRDVIVSLLQDIQDVRKEQMEM